MKKGDTSDIVVTDFGYHLIKVTDRTQGETTTFESVKDSVREVMAQDMDLYQTILAEQRKGGQNRSAYALSPMSALLANPRPSGRDPCCEKHCLV